MASFYLVLGLFIWFVFALWPAYVAKKKGYSFVLFLLASWVISFIITLIVAYALHDKNETEQDRADAKAAEAALDKEENLA